MSASEEPGEGTRGDGGPSAPTRVIIADDHPVFRAGIAAAIAERPEIELLDELEDGPGALTAIRRERPDVALLDIRMPGLDGPRLLRALSEEETPTKVLFLSAHVESELAHRLVSAGASGYLSKTASREEICDAILTVAAGATALAPEVETALIDELRRRDNARGGLLSAREEEVLGLLAEGSSARQIAERMEISEGTVKSHLRAVYEKLGVSGQAAAVAEAMRRGVLE